MKLAVVLNLSAGLALDHPERCPAAAVRAWFAKAGVEVEVRAVHSADLATALNWAVASGAEAVVVGGGDGTIAAAAELLAGTETALGILPLGTVNLLAHDLGLPREPQAAVAALATAEIRTIDIAEVNGRVFLNSSLLGLFPDMVRARERNRSRHGLQRWGGIVQAMAQSLRTYRLLKVEIDTGDGPRRVATPALAVTNNLFQRRRPIFLHRPVLDGGRMGIYLTRHQRRIYLLRFMARLLFGGWRRDVGLEMKVATALTVTSRRSQLDVVNDGEVLTLTTPLVYRLRPKALKVLVPHLSPPPPASSATKPGFGAGLREGLREGLRNSLRKGLKARFKPPPPESDQ
ncbi:diacylglycerol kinase (ATP) [uncultured Gammaproteobacteria bacterium]